MAVKAAKLRNLGEAIRANELYRRGDQMSKVRSAQSQRGSSVNSDPYSCANEEWSRGRLRSAFRLFLAAAKNGNDLAYDTLGSFYDRGVGTKRDEDAALYWYRRAYRRGSLIAPNNIGVIYRDRKDLKRALAWFRRAVEHKDANANLNIAKIYLNDKQDIERAIRHLEAVRKAKRDDATESAKEEARLLLKRISLKPKPRTTRSRARS
jgi:TPR repeat protein